MINLLLVRDLLLNYNFSQVQIAVVYVLATTNDIYVV